jgi:chromosome segregation ATPase
MKIIGIFTAILAVTAAFGSVQTFAGGFDAEVQALEQRALLVQTQIEKAKVANQAMLSSQIDGIKQSIDGLLKQRVAVDAQIAKLEQQIGSLKKNSQEELSRQIGNYEATISQIRSQISSLTKKPEDQAQSAKDLKGQLTGTQQTTQDQMKNTVKQ